MQVFVTGATGYVGSQLIGELLAAGHAVTALVRDPGPAQHLADRGVTLIVGDVRTIDGLMPAQTDAVVHLAASLFPDSDRSVNVEGSLAVLNEAQRVSVRRFIYMSSALVYGPSAPSVAVTETHPCRPNTSFARQQHAVEQAVLAAADTTGFPAVILRPSQIVGGHGGSFAAIVQRIRSGSMMIGRSHDQNLSLTDLTDLIDVVIACLDQELAPGEIFNVTSGSLPARDLYVRIAHALDVKPPTAVPAPVVLTAGALAGIYARLRGIPPQFSLDVAKVALFTAGPRATDKARAMLGFRARQPDPMRTVVETYLRSDLVGPGIR